MGKKHLQLDAALSLLLGISCYWAWSSVSLLTSSLWPNIVSEFMHITWIANVVAHLICLLVLGVLPKSSQKIFVALRFSITSAALIVVGTLILSFGFAMPFVLVAILGSITSGIGTAMMLIVWAQVYLRVNENSRRYFIVSGSVIVSFFIVILIADLPYPIALIVTICLPVTMICCFRRAHNTFEQLAPSEANPSQQQELQQPSNNQLATNRHPRAYFFRLILGCLTLALPAGLYQNGFSFPSGTEESGEWSQVIACACILIALIIFLDYFIARKFETSIFSRLAVPFMAGGLLILSVSTAGFSLFAGAFLQAGYYLFLIFIYTEFATLALDSQILSHRIVALGTCAIDIGLLCGFALVQAASILTNNRTTWAIAATAYLLLLGVILLFPQIMNSIESRRAAISSSKKSDTSYSNYQTLAIEQYGLSDREAEILQYLLEGRTLRNIADKTFLSYNTVKTHVSHIYHKVGVHTRDELIEAVKQ